LFYSIHIKVVLTPRAPKLRILTTKHRELDLRESTLTHVHGIYMGGMGSRGAKFRQALKHRRVGLDCTIDRDVRVGVERPRLTIPVVMCNTVPVWAIDNGA
jgi:hypothetical protein